MPESQELIVKADELTLIPDILVVGGGIKGKVMGLGNHPAFNVTILVDGEPKTWSDRTGIYYLDFDRVPASYEIKADHDDYLYEESITVYVDEHT